MSSDSADALGRLSVSAARASEALQQGEPAAQVRLELLEASLEDAQLLAAETDRACF